MIKERTYYNCANFNNHEFCTLRDNLKKVLNGTESFITRENEAYKYCSTCKSFKDIYETVKNFESIKRSPRVKP